jgi:hypothetical protein
VKLIQQVWLEKENRYVDLGPLWGPEVFDWLTDEEIAEIIEGEENDNE